MLKVELILKCWFENFCHLLHSRILILIHFHGLLFQFSPPVASYVFFCSENFENCYGQETLMGMLSGFLFVVRLFSFFALVMESIYMEICVHIWKSKLVIFFSWSFFLFFSFFVVCVCVFFFFCFLNFWGSWGGAVNTFDNLLLLGIV